MIPKHFYGTHSDTINPERHWHHKNPLCLIENTHLFTLHSTSWYQNPVYANPHHCWQERLKK